MAKFKAGDIVVNGSGTYSKILKVTNGVFNGTKWTEDITVAKESKKGGILFNESASKRLKIKLANKKDQVKDEDIKDVDVKNEVKDEE